MAVMEKCSDSYIASNPDVCHNFSAHINEPASKNVWVGAYLSCNNTGEHQNRHILPFSQSRQILDSKNSF